MRFGSEKVIQQGERRFVMKVDSKVVYYALVR